MYNLHLSPEQLEFRDTVRDFVEDEVKPVTLKADRLDLSDRTLPVEVLRKASQMGLRTLALPEDLGGVGADALTSCIVTEELAVDDTALGINYHRPAPEMRLATTATRDGDHWIVNGAKDCIANATVAKLIAVEAQTDKGAALFLVPRESAGLTVAAQPEPRWYHGSCGRLALEGVRVRA